METVSRESMIVTLHGGGTKGKTIEFQREMYEKYNVNQYPRLGFGSDMPPLEFQNFMWVMNNCIPKDFPANMVDKIKETSKGSVNAEVILFLNCNVVPLNVESIDFMIQNAQEGKIVNLSLYDGIAMSRETYNKLKTPNMRDLFSTARKNNVPVLTLRISNVDSDNCKTYCHGDKELFWQAGGENQEQKYWNKCEELLVRGIYEDRSIKH